MTSHATVLALGLVLGIKHAFETDHVAAVTTIVSEHKNPLRAALIGTFWGLGHTTTLLIVGLFVLIAKISIPEKVSLFFEMLVGFALVCLGLLSIMRILVSHKHSHHHGDTNHAHVHAHQSPNHTHFHKKSFLMGTLHGLAGSGALMILVLSTIKTTIEGIFYILLFSLGSIGAMTFISMVLGLPFILSARKFPSTQKYVTAAAGAVSVFVGLGLIYEIGIVQGLISVF